MRNRDEDLDWEEYKDVFHELVDEDSKMSQILFDFADSGYSPGYAAAVTSRLEVLEQKAINIVLERKRSEEGEYWGDLEDGV